MTPSAILLIICFSVFTILSVIFSLYLIKVFVREKKSFPSTTSTSTIAHFASAEPSQEKTREQKIPQYHFAKAK